METPFLVPILSCPCPCHGDTPSSLHGTRCLPEPTAEETATFAELGAILEAKRRELEPIWRDLGWPAVSTEVLSDE